MSLSESERRVLAQLEREFQPRPPVATPRGSGRWSRPRAGSRRAVATLGLSAGSLLLALGLILNSTGGTILAVLAYPLVVGSLATVSARLTHARAALARRATAIRVPHRYKYFR